MFDNQSCWFMLICAAPGQCTVRGHPGSLFALKRTGIKWTTRRTAWHSSPLRKNMTINSSVGLEAMRGKPEVLGDCAHRFHREAGDERTRVARLAFYLFAYLFRWT